MLNSTKLNSWTVNSLLDYVNTARFDKPHNSYFN